MFLAGCRREAAGASATDKSGAESVLPAIGLDLTVVSDNARPLPRELDGTSLGLGMTLDETRIRLPDLTPDGSLDFAATPNYYVCDEISVTQDFILSQARNAATMHARPAGDGLGSIELYALDGAISALRGLYLESDVRKTSYGEFVAQAAKKYGISSRSSSWGYSDGTVVRYTLWQNLRTTILIGETDPPKEAPATRYIYLIDGLLLRDSFRAAAGRGPQLGEPTVF